MYVAIAPSESELGEAQNQSLRDGQIQRLFSGIQFCDTRDSVKT